MVNFEQRCARIALSIMAYMLEFSRQSLDIAVKISLNILQYNISQHVATPIYVYSQRIVENTLSPARKGKGNMKSIAEFSLSSSSKTKVSACQTLNISELLRCIINKKS